jgi:hypothetical protein
MSAPKVTKVVLSHLVYKIKRQSHDAGVDILREFLQDLLVMDDERLVGCLCACHSDPMREVHATCVDCQREMLAERPVASPEALTVANQKIKELETLLRLPGRG